MPPRIAFRQASASAQPVSPVPRRELGWRLPPRTKVYRFSTAAIEPLNVTQHGKMKVRPVLDMSEVAKTHAIPLTVDEFSLVQRHYPIVFSIGEKPIPIALMGLNENVNVFLEEDGRPMDPSLYIPAYVRRYPFLLARIRPDSDELSLCFDPTANAVGDFKEGEALFDGEQPSKATLAILEFCEQFEAAGQRTRRSWKSW